MWFVIHRRWEISRGIRSSVYNRDQSWKFFSGLFERFCAVLHHSVVSRILSLTASGGRVDRDGLSEAVQRDFVFRRETSNALSGKDVGYLFDVLSDNQLHFRVDGLVGSALRFQICDFNESLTHDVRDHAADWSVVPLVI